MIPAVSPTQLDRFQRAITRRMALQVDLQPAADLAATLGRRAHARGMAVEAYLAWLESGAADGDVPGLARELTVGETSFFRHIEQFHALRETVVPELLERAPLRRPLRVLSAGCASGEEACSIAITLSAMDEDGAGAWRILAVDVNPTMIDKARKGLYTPWALRDTPPTLRRRWFRVEGGKVAVDARVREAIRFEQRNLAADDDELWRPDAYDIVFCRNVLMYFAPPAAQAVLARIERSLAPDGALFLGHAETLRGLSPAFELHESQGAFYYRRGPRAGAQAASRTIPGWVPADRSGAVAGSSQSRAAAYTAVTTPRGSAGAAKPVPETIGGAPSSSRALALFRQDRFDEALAVLGALDDAAARAPDAMLLKAALLTHRGRFAPAEQACRRLLAIDVSHAGAFHLLALCRDGLRDAAGAAREDRCAIALDPGFAMPRLHLGLLCRRAGDLEGARRHLGEAMRLLEREDAARLALFGGGFGREALVAVCRAELRQVEEAS